MTKTLGLIWSTSRQMSHPASPPAGWMPSASVGGPWSDEARQWIVSEAIRGHVARRVSYGAIGEWTLAGLHKSSKNRIGNGADRARRQNVGGVLTQSSSVG